MLLAMHDGRKFDFNNLKPEDFRIEDIAHALANICRFGGHSPQFYSVAQHCVIMAGLAAELGYDKRTQRTALMHDASEAYLGDVVRHIKVTIPFYKNMEHKMMFALAERFDFDYPLPEIIEAMDHDMLETEMRTFWRDRDISWLPTYGVPMKLTIDPWGRRGSSGKILFLQAWRHCS